MGTKVKVKSGVKAAFLNYKSCSGSISEFKTSRKTELKTGSSYQANSPTVVCDFNFRLLENASLLKLSRRFPSLVRE